jgi:hypothetical protein
MLDCHGLLCIMILVSFAYLFKHISCNFSYVKKVNLPITGMNRPLMLQEVAVPRISRQLAHQGGTFVSPTHRPPLTPRR